MFSRIVVNWVLSVAIDPSAVLIRVINSFLASLTVVVTVFETVVNEVLVSLDRVSRLVWRVADSRERARTVRLISFWSANATELKALKSENLTLSTLFLFSNAALLLRSTCTAELR
jgi:hypothetical protein